MQATLQLPQHMPRVDEADDSPLRDPDAVVRELRLAAALFLFEHGRISNGRGAELAGVTRAEFLQACGRHGIVVVDYDPDDLAADYDAIRADKVEKAR